MKSLVCSPFASSLAPIPTERLPKLKNPVAGDPFLEIAVFPNPPKLKSVASEISVQGIYDLKPTH